VQNLLKNAGGLNKPTIFLITDSQFKEEVFLEDIDSLLNASEVPNLFAADEKVEVIEVRIIVCQNGRHHQRRKCEFFSREIAYSSTFWRQNAC